MTNKLTQKKRPFMFGRLCFIYVFIYVLEGWMNDTAYGYFAVDTVFMDELLMLSV